MTGAHPLRCIIDHAKGRTVCGRRPDRDGIITHVAADPARATCPQCRDGARHLFPLAQPSRLETDR